jgi:hypothetical protein
VIRVAAGAVVLTWPGWLGRAFAQTADDEAVELEGTIAWARAAGRPVLVIVVPADVHAWVLRGEAWGELLNYGPDLAMADLTLADVVCAHAPTLRALVTGAPEGEPVAVVIEPDGTVTSYDPPLAERPDRRERQGDEEYEASAEAAVDARIASLTRLVHDALAADDAMIARRAQDARTARGVSSAWFAQALGGAPLTAELAAEAPAEVYAATRRVDAADAAPWLAALTRLGIRRLRLSRIPGSRWARSTGCGAILEGPSERYGGMPCGMGWSPARSVRFLSFLVGS